MLATPGLCWWKTATNRADESLPTNSKIFAPQESAQTKEAPTKAVKPPKENSKNSTEPGMIKFFVAMFGVLFSSLVIFGGLKFYNFLLSKKGSTSTAKGNKKSLESPKTFKEALNSFLEKTDK